MNKFPIELENRINKIGIRFKNCQNLFFYYCGLGLSVAPAPPAPSLGRLAWLVGNPPPTEWKCLKLKGSTISSPKNIIRTRTLIKKESKNILGIYVFMVLLSVVRLPLDFILVSILIIKRSFFSIWETNVRLSNFFESILGSDNFIFIRVKLKS